MTFASLFTHFGRRASHAPPPQPGAAVGDRARSRTHGPDGLSYIAHWDRLRRHTQWLWGAIPEIPAVALPLVFAAPDLAAKPSWAERLRTTAAAVRRRLAIDAWPGTDLPRCEALLYHASWKPNIQPATDRLAAALARAGVTTATVTRDQSISLWQPDGRRAPPSPALADYRQWLEGAGSRPQTLVALLRATLATLVLLPVLVADRHLRPFADPFRVWLMLFEGAVRLSLYDRMLALMGTRFVLVNFQRMPFASELSLAAWRRGIHCVYFSNEYPGIQQVPLLVHEVWLWNQPMVDWLARLVQPAERPVYAIVGHAESNSVLTVPQPCSAEEQALREAVGKRPVCVLLSDFDSNRPWELVDLQRSCVEWMARAAAALPDWVFVIKARTGHAAAVDRFPGREFLDGVPNLLLPAYELSYLGLLQWDRVRVVAAAHSSGVLTAAGVGKAAVRLFPDGDNRHLPIVDDVAVPLRTAEALTAFLRGVPAGPDQRTGLPEIDESFFPYRGRTVERMAALALARLRPSEATAQGGPP